MHCVLRASDYHLGIPATFAGNCGGYRAAPLIGAAQGSVHTGLMLNALARKGLIESHFHSYEEGFYVLEGEVQFQVDGRTWDLRPGDFGVVKVGGVHSWRNAGSGDARWLEMAAPQPKPVGAERDTFFPGRVEGSSGPTVLGEARGVTGHFGFDEIPRAEEGRITGGGLHGVFLRWLIDDAFGAVHHRLALIEYQPMVSIGRHDHTFEEAYFIVSGEIEAVLDGTRYTAGPGDVLWTGVGCVHSFANVGNAPVRWLETFAPQPPRENVFRFMAEWEQLARMVEGR